MKDNDHRIAYGFYKYRLTGICDDTNLNAFYKGKPTPVNEFGEIIVQQMGMWYIEIVTGLPIPCCNLEDYSDTSMYPLIMKVPHSACRGEYLDMEHWAETGEDVTVGEIKKYKAQYTKEERREAIKDFIKQCKKSAVRVTFHLPKKDEESTYKR